MLFTIWVKIFPLIGIGHLSLFPKTPIKGIFKFAKAASDLGSVISPV